MFRLSPRPMRGCANSPEFVVKKRTKPLRNLLRDWNAGGAGGEEALPIERVLDSIVAPIAAHAPVLLLVLDGLSFAVARPLVADIGRQGWTELSPAGRTSPPPRCGGPSNCYRDFPDKPPLGAPCPRECRAGAHCLRLHINGCARFQGQGSRRYCSTRPTSAPDRSWMNAFDPALADTGQRVVGIVHNAVDAQLAGSDQIEVLWSTEVLRQLAPVLRAAREAGRLIILTGDHGHVLDAGTTLRPSRPRRPLAIRRARAGRRDRSAEWSRVFS